VPEVHNNTWAPQRLLRYSLNKTFSFFFLEVGSSSLGLFEVWKRNGRQASKMKGACLLIPFFELFFFFLFFFIFYF
jgi:hypothetical protein